MVVKTTLAIAATRPLLVSGDRMDAEEFHRRYEQMPEVKKAELIDGVVYMPSPVSVDHAEPDSIVANCLFVYRNRTPGLKVFQNATYRSSPFDEIQPDANMFILPEYGGRSRYFVHKHRRYLTGSPELLVEISVSTTRHDTTKKKRCYEKGGVQEYLVVRVEAHKVDWWQLVEGAYQKLPADEKGIVRSAVYPGLWLDTQAVFADRADAALAVLEQGMASPEHAAFAASLAARKN